MVGGLSAAEPNLWDSILETNVVNVIVAISLALSMCWYYQRRHMFPLKGRGSRAIVLCCFLYLVILISLAIRGPSVPCIVDTIIYCVCSHCGCALYIYRTVVLLVRHDIAEEIQLGPLKSTACKRSFLHHPKLAFILNFRVWSVGLPIYGMFLGLVFFCIALGMGDGFRCRGMVAQYSNYVLIGASVPVLLILAYHIRRFPSDGRKISIEFRCMSFCIVTALIVQVCLSQLLTFAYSGTYILDAVGLALMSTSLLFPISLSYRYRYRRKRSTSSSFSGTQNIFGELLHSEDFCQAFLMHLKSEFNAESLVFWQGVTKFKEKGDRPTEELIMDINELFANFLVPSAPYLLNTSMTSIEFTEECYRSAQLSGSGFLNVFDEILHEVVNLMKSDPLPRFLRSDAGRPWALQFREHSQSAKRPSAYLDHSTKNASTINDSPHVDNSIRRHSLLAVDLELVRRTSLSIGPLPAAP